MRVQIIRVIAEKDIRVTLQSKAVVLPLIIIPLFFMIVLPIVISVAPRFVDLETEAEIARDPYHLMVRHLPKTLQVQQATLSPQQQFVTLIGCYAIVPLFLIIPLMVASIFAANSFAGELERKTLEALLYSPATDWELFLGKFAAALVPAVATSWLGFVLFAITINTAAWPIMGKLFFPPASWILILFWVVPAVAGLGAAVLILVSSKVKNFMEAQQLGAVIVVPFLALLAGQLTGVLYFGSLTSLAIGALFWVIDAVVLAIGAGFFRRSMIVTKI